MLKTLREQEIPDGVGDRDNPTVPEKPDAGETTIVEVPLAPAVNVTEDGEEPTVKAETNTAIDTL